MAAIKLFLEEQYERLILWYVGFYVLGILVYFSLIDGPSTQFILLLCGAAIISSIFLKKKGDITSRFVILVFLSFTAGFTISFIRTISLHPVAIKSKIPEALIRAYVTKIKPTPFGAQITLSDLNIDGLSEEETPSSVRLNISKFSYKHIFTGDYIELKAKLSPPAENITPHSYNFRQIAFFNKIGAIGQVISEPEILEYNIGSIMYDLLALRKYIYEVLLEKLGYKNGNFAAAMFIGETGGIDKTTLDNMRIAGVSHVLCVSGLHLSTVAFIFFISFRFLLNFSDYLSFRFDIKKMAASLSFLASFLYLILTGSQIAATRAFIMTSIFILSILISKQPYPLRSLAVAAIIILTINPEYVIHPSFQLSFVAVLSLLVGYEYYIKNMQKIRAYPGFLGVVRLYIISNIYSSLVASLATAPIVMYHFYLYSNYSLIANLVIVPLFGTITMPIGILAIILSKFAIADYLFFILNLSLDIMKYVAKFVTSIPYSVIYTGYLTQISITIYLVSLFWICFWGNKVRNLGIAGIFCFFISFFCQEKPDILFNSESNFVASYNGQSRPIIYSSSVNSFAKKFIANWYGFASADKKQPSSDIVIINQDASIDIKSHLMMFKNKTYQLHNLSAIYLNGEQAEIIDYASKRFAFYSNLKN